MKLPLSPITPQFIINEKGKKTAVILDIKSFEKLLEEVEDIYLGAISEKALREDGESISHDEVKKKALKKGK